MARRLSQLATQCVDFLLKCADLVAQVVAALVGTARLVACLTVTVHGWHGCHLPSGAFLSRTCV